MNNKRRFIIEEIRTYLNKRNKKEKLNRRNRQIEYPNRPTDLKMGERMRVRKSKQKSMAFENERTEAEMLLQKE